VTEAVGKRVRGAFLPPPNVRQVDVNPRTGAVAEIGCPERFREFFLVGTEPVRVCNWRGEDVEPDDIDPRERSIWERIFGR
jgi:hypothetical protein